MDEKLPEGWVETTLEEIVEIRDDLRLPVNADERARRSGPYPYYGATGQVGWIDDYLIDGEYVLLGEDGAPFLDPLKPKAYLVSGKCWVNNHAHVLHFLENLGNNRFLLYALNTIDYHDVVNGTTRLKLTQSAMRQMHLFLAPLPEQSRIVAAIEQQFTRLDSAVASLQSAKARVKQYRASLLKSAVEGELTKEWRIEHRAEETGKQLLKRILVERRARWEEAELAKMREKGIVPKDNKWKEGYKEPQEPDTENLPELPEGWCWTTLESIAYIQLGKMLSPKAFEQHLVQLPYLRNENIRWGFINYSDVKTMGFKEEEMEKYSVLPNDLLVCEGGEPGRCAVYKEIIAYENNQKQLMYQKALHRVRMIENIISPHFIQLCLQHYVASQTIIPKFSETTIKHLPLEKISILPFPLPPLGEIEQIVDEIEAKLSNIEQLEATIEANLKRAEHERQSILQEAFAGRLVLQDMNDEPANVLLERIREERKKREDAEKIVKASRKGDHVGSAKRPRVGKVASGQRNIGLYEKLVEAGQPLSPDDLFKGVGLRADAQPESVEEFYEELHADVVAGLIEEGRPSADKVMLYAVEHDNEDLEEVEVLRENSTVPVVEEMQKVREEENRRSLWDA